MAIRIPPKFGFKVQDNQPRVSVSERLKAWSKKLDDDRTTIKPHLGELFGLYRHYCTLFLPGDLSEFGVMYYCGDGYGISDENRDEDYERVGQILARI